MSLKAILTSIEEIADTKGLSTPFICGGAPRDKVMGQVQNIEDIDLTTGNKDIHELAKEVSLSLPEASYRIMPDGHAQIMLRGTKLDFSSNYHINNIELILSKGGVINPTEMQCELYSRDFTCNALLMSLDLKEIKDPTGLGMPDIKKKLLRTCLPASITLGVMPKRVIRIIYLAAKLGFEVDQEIIDWVKKNPQSLLGAKKSDIANKLNKALDYNKDIVINLLDKMELWKYLPINDVTSKLLTPGRI